MVIGIMLLGVGGGVPGANDTAIIDSSHPLLMKCCKSTINANSKHGASQQVLLTY